MTDKTCGNCANGECEAIRCLITQDTHVPCFVCANYVERTDSLEQMLNDAIEGCDELLGMFDNMNSNGLLQYGCYSQLFEQLCCINERIETARDRALGVEVEK